MKLSTSTKNQEIQKNLDPVLEVIFSKNGSAKEKYESVGFFYNKILQIFRIKPTLDALHLSQLKKEDKTLVLTFGTGGFLLEKIITTVKPIHRVHGIDFSKKMHAITNQRLSRLNIQDKVELKLENVLNMPYDSESFDVIFAIHILDIMKINDIPRLLLQIRRVLKSNGRLVVVAMTKDGKFLIKIMRCFYEWLYQHWPETLGYRPSSRPIYIEDALREARFEIINSRMTYIWTLGFPLKIIVAKKQN